jgi:hypothetical protein
MDLLKPGTLRRVFLGCCIQMWSQLSGMNVSPPRSLASTLRAAVLIRLRDSLLPGHDVLRHLCEPRPVLLVLRRRSRLTPSSMPISQVFQSAGITGRRGELISTFVQYVLNVVATIVSLLTDLARS